MATTPDRQFTSPNHGSGRAQTVGVVIHSTRGGANTPQLELQATKNHFLNASAEVSSHRVVGINGEHYQFVDDDLMAWHAQELNSGWLSIELAQPRITDDFTEAQYGIAAEIVRDWAKQYRFPIDREHIVGHEETPQGRRVGKTDPGPKFDWGKFMRMLMEAPMPEEGRKIGDFTVAGPFLKSWDALGGKLGNPRGDSVLAGQVWAQDFDSGTLVWRKGEVIVLGLEV